MIIGAGVAGIFTAIELINKGYNGSDITILDKGHMLNRRICFADNNTPCKKCKVCSISNGVGGTGSFSDSKLNFDPTGKVGGDLARLLTTEEITEGLKDVYEIYKTFGIEEFKSKVYRCDATTDTALLDKIKKQEGVEFANCATLHLGTDNSRIVYQRMIDFLINHGVEIIPNAEVSSVSAIEKLVYYYKQGSKEISYKKLILAMGRSGNQLMRKICELNNIRMIAGDVDVGVRVETLNEIMKPLNDNFYEAKLYFTGQFGDTTRIFCNNPGGVVSIESYPHIAGNIYLANGHAYSDESMKTNNTNFALLVTRHFNEDTPNPLDDYLYPLMQATNSLGKGQVIMQSYSDIMLNRRSTDDRIKQLDIVPSVKAYAGDVTSVMPYRTMVDILQALESLNNIVPGICGSNTLLYAPEAKFHANKIAINKAGLSSIPDIYCIGDSSGWTRGITSAASMGIACADDIIKGDL